ncbi:MAG: sodium/glutamate symporter [Phycisphaerae bacterium]
MVELFIALSLLVGAGHLLRTLIKPLQWLYIPSAVIGGVLGLAVVQVAQATGNPLPAEWIATAGKLPGFLINVVFACLFLGVTLPGLRTIWRRSAPQLAYGQTVAWGQYVVGVGLVVLLLGPIFGLPNMFGGILPVGFEGGHGTAGGLQDTFRQLEWEEGGSFALTSATFGVCSAIVFGMVLINWAVRRGYTARKVAPGASPEDDVVGIIPVGSRPSAGRLTVRSDAIESLTLHVAIVGLAVLIGYLIKLGLVGLAGLLAAEDSAVHTLLRSIPLFPLCMVGGLVVQLLEQKFDKHKIIDLGLTRRIQNTSLDFLVVAAIAVIRLNVVLESWIPFMILMVAGVAWNIFCVTVLARRMLPGAWFERSIAEMGQSMGVTATGLLLLRAVDPDYETDAADAFAYKQILHEPFMGGGLWTSFAIPLLAIWGGWQVLLVSVGAVAFWLVFSLVLKRLRAGA